MLSSLHPYAGSDQPVVKCYLLMHYDVVICPSGFLAAAPVYCVNQWWHDLHASGSAQLQSQRGS